VRAAAFSPQPSALSLSPACPLRFLLPPPLRGRAGVGGSPRPTLETLPKARRAARNPRISAIPRRKAALKAAYSRLFTACFSLFRPVFRSFPLFSRVPRCSGLFFHRAAGREPGRQKFSGSHPKWRNAAISLAPGSQAGARVSQREPIRSQSGAKPEPLSRRPRPGAGARPAATLRRPAGRARRSCDHDRTCPKNSRPRRVWRRAGG
jgi:hypothetical protein